jgi:hypothetical protein
MDSTPNGLNPESTQSGLGLNPEKDSTPNGLNHDWDSTPNRLNPDWDSTPSGLNSEWDSTSNSSQPRTALFHCLNIKILLFSLNMNKSVPLSKEWI